MNKWMKQINELEGAVTGKYDPYKFLLRTPSPSVNWTFGRTHGLPFGYSALWWGPPKAGKTLLSNATVGQLHRDDEDAIAIKFDTEMRDEGQMDETTAKAFGIDLDRYKVLQVNKPAQVFNVIKDKLGAMMQKGAPIKLIIIDSITGVLGRVEANSKKGVEQFGMGDHAQTIQIGLKSCVLELQRKKRFALILTAHARAEMDQMRIKQGHKMKAAVSFGALHHCEYFQMVAKNDTKKGRTDVLGHEMVDESLTDFKGTSENTGHKIRVWMTGNTVGVAGRTGEFAIDYNRGIVNQHHEAFELGLKRAVIGHPTASGYIINGVTYNGKAKAVNALKDPKLQAWVAAELVKDEARRRLLPSSQEEEEVELDTNSDDDDDEQEDDEDETESVENVAE